MTRRSWFPYAVLALAGALGGWGIYTLILCTTPWPYH